MKRTYSVVVAIILLSMLSVGTRAQDAQADTVPKSPWSFSGDVALLFNQVHFLHWVPGGQNTISIEGSTRMQLQFKQDRHLWLTKLQLGYGMTKFDKEDFVKHLDVFDFGTQYGFQASKMWYYSAFAGLKTQFSPAYKDPKAKEKEKISDIFSPLFFTLSLGIDFRPDEHFSALMSPLTGRLTYCRSQMLADRGFFALKPKHFDENKGEWIPGKHTRWELGAFLKFGYVNRFFQDQFGIDTRLEFFSNYLEKPQNIDVTFDCILDYKLLKFLSLRLQVTMVYDDDMRIPNAEGRPIPYLQLRESFGVGLAYFF